MAVLNVSGNPKFAPSKEQVERFAALFDDETGVFLRVHQTLKGTPTRFYEMHLKGPDHIVEEMRLQHKTLRFKISPASFFQPNTLQAEVLYDAVISLLGADHLVVYDLYCGTGTLGMAAAAAAREVIGIELSAEAVLDAQENAAKNGISNIRLIQGDVGRVLTKLLGEPGFCRPDAVIVDPPRAGLDELALHHLRLLSPKTIVYVSCNPITQAENIRFFKEAGYVLKTLLGVDQFPHTAHIESIALLKK
jgi:23S rRNA (uracil1939-C5)-methyltransferase